MSWPACIYHHLPYSRLLPSELGLPHSSNRNDNSCSVLLLGLERTRKGGLLKGHYYLAVPKDALSHCGHKAREELCFALLTGTQVQRGSGTCQRPNESRPQTRTRPSSLALSVQAALPLPAWMGLVSVGSCLGRENTTAALRNAGQSRDKSLRPRKSRGDRTEPVGEMSRRRWPLNLQGWRRTSWGSARERAGLVAVQAPSSSQ